MAAACSSTLNKIPAATGSQQRGYSKRETWENLGRPMTRKGIV